MNFITDKKIKIPLVVFVLYIFWGFIFSQTVVANNMMVYASFLFLFVSFGYVAINSGVQLRDGLTIIWLPFLLLTSVSFLVKGDLEHFSYWFVCICLCISAGKRNFIVNIPFRLLLYSGLFAMIGVFFELLFPNIYSSTVSPLFLSSDQISFWSEGEYGLAGFTYQLDTTAVPILYAEGVLITLFADRLRKISKGGYIFYCLILVLLIIGVFLTGKRLLSLIALVLPFILLILKQNNRSKTVFALLLISTIGYMGYQYFVSHVENFTDNIFVRRMAISVIDSRAGADISTSRSYLFDLAWKAYNSSPMFGIGVGNFMKKTGAYTDVHNAYLQVLCEQGIVGVVLFVFPLVICLMSTIRLLRARVGQIDDSFKLLLLSLFVQLVFIIYGLTGNPTLNTFGYMMYFLSITILIQAKNYNYEEGFTYNL